MRKIFYFVIASILVSCSNVPANTNIVFDTINFDDITEEHLEECSLETKMEVLADIAAIKLMDDTIKMLYSSLDNLTEKDIRTYYKTRELNGFKPYIEYENNASDLAGFAIKYEKNVYKVPEAVVSSILKQISSTRSSNWDMYVKYKNNL